DQATTGDIGYALHRASSMYHRHPDIMTVLRDRIMSVDLSWEKSIEKYLQVYRWIGAYIEPAGPAVEIPTVEKAPLSPPAAGKGAAKTKTSNPKPVAAEKAPVTKAPAKKTSVKGKPPKAAVAEKAPKPEATAKQSPAKGKKTNLKKDT
ncbi:MAG: hypothetical protein ABIQ93_01465, partial [Saprospiraceae bacterium]